MSADSLFWAAVAYIGISIIFLLLGLIVVYGLVRKIATLWSKTGSLFGESTKVRLVSLGLAVLFFPDVLPNLVTTIGSFVRALVVEVSMALYANWQSNVHLHSEAKQFHQFAVDLGFGFIQAWATAISRAFQQVSSFPFNQLILLLTLWAIAAYLFTEAQATYQSATNTSRGRFWLTTLYSRLGSAAANNIMFFLILAVGGYLSIAAIAAIPGLQEKSITAQEISVERLKVQLEESLNTFKKYPTDVGSTDPLDRLEAFLAASTAVVNQSPADINVNPANKADNPAVDAGSEVSVNRNSNKNGNTTRTSNDNASQTAANGLNNSNNSNSQNTNPSQPPNVASKPNPTRPLPEYVVTYGQSIVRENRRNRAELLSLWKDNLASAKSQQETLKDSAVRIYEVGNLDRKGNKEKIQHFLDITKWFNERGAAFNGKLSQGLSSLQDLDQVWKTWADQMVSELSSRDSVEFPAFPSAPVYESLHTARMKLRTPAFVNEEVPARPALGSSFLGPFGIVASWLLNTESLPLALITGLLGFGLLGSACSTFIREHLRESHGAAAKHSSRPGQSNGRIVMDLTGVVIRGLSAAVVVFLAVEGGLAIFAVGGGEPNPYVLLLTCLIAAVFSEKVWEWAHRQLDEKLGETKEEGEAEEEGETEEEGEAEKGEEEKAEDDGLDQSRDVAKVQDNPQRGSPPESNDQGPSSDHTPDSQ